MASQDKPLNNYGLLTWSGTSSLASRVLPSYTLFPNNNDRTAWKPFGYPVVLTIPGRRTKEGLEVAGTLPESLTIRVLGAPDRPFVNGHDHVGERFPEEIVYIKTIDAVELLSLQIDTSIQDFYDSNNNLIVAENVKDGDRMYLTLASGVFDKIVWFQDVDYFDLSNILFETVGLPNGYYSLEYSLNYNQRILTRDGNNIVCVTDNIVPSSCRIPFNHPGDVLADFVNGLVPIDFSGATLDKEPTIDLFRPVLDSLQDIFDEQGFLQSINWVRDIQFPLVPYLVPTLGWDIPFFPKSADDLRKAVLLSLAEIQKTRGSITAINRLFNLFGFTVLVNNLYFIPGATTYTKNDTIGPDEYPDFTLETDGVVDPLLVATEVDGFGQSIIPLVYRPQSLDGVDPFKSNKDSGSVTIHSFLVAKDSVAENQIRDYLTTNGSIGPLTGSVNSVDSSGFATTDDLVEIEQLTRAEGLINYSLMRMANGIVASSMIVGDGGPISTVNATMDIEKNLISLSYDRYVEFDGTSVVYSVAVYERIKINLPAALENRRSNYFDVQILSKIDNLLPTDASILGFLLDFIYRVKAAHSLLRAFRYLSVFEETYMVGDWCVGYDVTQRFDVDAGVQQVPPAVIPYFPSGSCIDSPLELSGFKSEDYAYRTHVINGATAEYEAYQLLSERDFTHSIIINLPTSSPDACGYMKYGQSIIIKDSRTEEDALDVIPGIGANSLQVGQSPANLIPPNDDDHINTTVVGKVDALDKHIVAEAMKYYSGYGFVCAPSVTSDWCFKGRVEDELSTTHRVPLEEQYDLGVISCRTATLGSGSYWYYVSPSNLYSKTGMNLMVNVDNTVKRNLTFSGGKLGFNQNLLPDFNNNGKPKSWLGRIIASMNKSVILCFSNRPGLDDIRPESNLALTPNSLNITIPSLQFQNCRLVMMRNLLTDFVSPIYSKRPWDQGGCNSSANFLNARLIQNGEDEQLVFDTEPFTVLGNGLPPDIDNMSGSSSSTVSDDNNIWHAVYSNNSPRPYDNPTTTYTDSETIVTDRPLFDTAVYDSSTGLFTDAIDGYPSDVGEFSFVASGTSEKSEIMSALGMPIFAGTFNVLFTMGSAIYVANHDGTDGTWYNGTASRRPYSIRMNCSIEADEYGGESATLETVAPFSEVFGSPWKMDGSIPNMLNIGAVPKL